jgi:hypothetical protein
LNYLLNLRILIRNIILDNFDGFNRFLLNVIILHGVFRRSYQVKLQKKTTLFCFYFYLFLKVQSINIYFLTDYFYTISSSRSNWESIDGALLAHSDQCNNNLPALMFNESSYSIVTVPILIQSFYVLVFQVNIVSFCYFIVFEKSNFSFE